MSHTHPFVIVETSPELRQSALDRFEQRTDSASFADCLVMAFADAYSTHDIFGFDAVFTKSGYQGLSPDQRPEAA